MTTDANGRPVPFSEARSGPASLSGAGAELCRVVR